MLLSFGIKNAPIQEPSGSGLRRYTRGATQLCVPSLKGKNTISLSHTHDMRRLDNGCEIPFLPTRFRENPPEAIRSTRMHRRPTLSGSLCHAVMKVLFSVTGF